MDHNHIAKRKAQDTDVCIRRDRKYGIYLEFMVEWMDSKVCKPTVLIQKVRKI